MTVAVFQCIDLHGLKLLECAALEGEQVVTIGNCALRKNDKRRVELTRVDSLNSFCNGLFCLLAALFAFSRNINRFEVGCDGAEEGVPADGIFGEEGREEKVNVGERIKPADVVRDDDGGAGREVTFGLDVGGIVGGIPEEGSSRRSIYLTYFLEIH